MGAKVVDPAARTRAIEAYRAGASLEDAATIAGVTSTAALKWVQHAGCWRGSALPPAEERRVRALEMAREGAGVTEIAKQVRARLPTVRRWLEAAGHDVPRRGQARRSPDMRPIAGRMVLVGYDPEEILRRTGVGPAAAQRAASQIAREIAAEVHGSVRGYSADADADAETRARKRQIRNRQRATRAARRASVAVNAVDAYGRTRRRAL